MSNQSEVSQVVLMIGAAYPNFAPTKETVQVYYELLKDLPADLLKAAALQCCAEAGRKFAPSVGELRGAAVELEVKSQGIPSTLEAWNEVCRAPKNSEYRKLVDDSGQFVIEVHPFRWSHPLVESVARMLGWPDFPNPENESVDRAHFFKQYEAELNRLTSKVIELPEVTRYIASRAGEQVKQLAEGMKA